MGKLSLAVFLSAVVLTAQYTAPNATTDVAVTVTPVSSTTVTAAGPTAVGTSSTQALAANSGRKRLTLQNTGTTNIYVLLGPGTASAANYHFILRQGNSLNDGSSPQYLDTMWQGAIQWASSGPGGQAVAFENT